MTRRRKTASGRPQLCGWVFAPALLGLAMTVMAGGYPPPPGSYQSEPVERTPPPAQTRSGMLPLPRPGEDGAGAAGHDATRLFGAPPAARYGQPPGDQAPRFQPRPEGQSSTPGPAPQGPSETPLFRPRDLAPAY